EACIFGQGRAISLQLHHVIVGDEEVVRLPRHRMMNLGPVPIHFEVVLDDAALQKERYIRVGVENQPAARQILDVIFERRGGENPAVLQLLTKGFGIFRSLLDLLEPEASGIGGDRRPQDGRHGFGEGRVIAKFRSCVGVEVHPYYAMSEPSSWAWPVLN